MTEWRAIPSAPNYEASADGRVRRSVGGQGARAGVILSPRLSRNGYLTLKLRHTGTKRAAYVHRLVCEAFHGAPPSNFHEVAHANGIRRDNSACNLSWKTRSENHQDKARHGTLLIGERHPCAILTEQEVLEIRTKHQEGAMQTVLAQAYEVSEGTIFDVVHHKKWRHLP